MRLSLNTLQVLQDMSHLRIFGHPHVQERWERPEEEYYEAKHGLDASSNGKVGMESEELEIDAGPKGSSKIKRMHPFGLGIRQVLSQHMIHSAFSNSIRSCRCCCCHLRGSRKFLSQDDEPCEMIGHSKAGEISIFGAVQKMSMCCTECTLENSFDPQDAPERALCCN